MRIRAIDAIEATKAIKAFRRCTIPFATIFPITFFLTTLHFQALANEPSAFEQQSGVIKNDIKTLQSIVTSLQQKVESLQQAQEGISSLHESQSAKIKEQLIQSSKQDKDIKELSTLKAEVQNNSNEIKLLKAQLKELNKSLSTLNQTILTELKSLNAPQSQANATKSADSTAPKAQAKASVDFIKDKSKKAQIFNDAQTAITKSQFHIAKPRLEWLIEENYKKADSHFSLGEIAFVEKSYNTAIYHYKQSALLNDKAKYMPTLLLHTAQSFNAIKDLTNYNKFLDSLIGNYPNSKEAKEAKALQSQNKDNK